MTHCRLLESLVGFQPPFVRYVGTCDPGAVAESANTANFLTGKICSDIPTISVRAGRLRELELHCCNLDNTDVFAELVKSNPFLEDVYENIALRSKI